LHKPSGYVCTREQGEHKTVYDLLPVPPLSISLARLLQGSHDADLTYTHAAPSSSLLRLQPDFYKRRPLLNICGRLDRWVTGLVFLTQDGTLNRTLTVGVLTSRTHARTHARTLWTGQLQHQVASPNRKAKKRLGKTYIIKAWRGFNGNEPEIFKAGTLMLNGETKPCKPADLEILDPVNNMAKYTRTRTRTRTCTRTRTRTPLA
jgi:16S rRNA U516 pseudouridylate synthase RsuA-like enzyme